MCVSLDVNECLTNNGGCRAGTRCFNTAGAHLCGPFFVTHTLHLAPSTESTCTFDEDVLNGVAKNTTATHIELTNTQGGERLCVAVKRVDLTLGEAKHLRLRYGSLARPFEFQPLILNISASENTQFVFLEFQSVAGIGHNLSVHLLLANDSQWLSLASPPVLSSPPSNIDCELHKSADLFSYPHPHLLSGSLTLLNISSLSSSAASLLRQPDLAPAVDHFNDSLVLPNSEAYWVELRGVNLYPRAGHMRVHYGPSSDLTR